MTLLKKTLGFSIIELLIAIVILGLLAAIAAPAFNGFFERHRLKGLAESLYLDILDARAQAIQTNSTIFISVTNGNNWCYGMDDSATDCDCTVANDCTVGGIEQVVRLNQFAGTSITTTLGAVTSTSGITSNAFESMRGLPANSGRYNLSNAVGDTMAVHIRPTGRVYICSNTFGDYQACP